MRREVFAFEQARSNKVQMRHPPRSDALMVFERVAKNQKFYSRIEGTQDRAVAAEIGLAASAADFAVDGK